MQIADLKMKTNQDACEVIFDKDKKQKEEIETLQKQIKEQLFMRKLEKQELNEQIEFLKEKYNKDTKILQEKIIKILNFTDLERSIAEQININWANKLTFSENK